MINTLITFLGQSYAGSMKAFYYYFNSLIVAIYIGWYIRSLTCDPQWGFLRFFSGHDISVKENK